MDGHGEKCLRMICFYKLQKNFTTLENDSYVLIHNSYLFTQRHDFAFIKGEKFLFIALQTSRVHPKKTKSSNNT